MLNYRVMRPLGALFGLLSIAGLFLLSSSAFAQSVTDNIRPVGQVCLAGQPCVGAAVSNSAQVDEAGEAPEIEQANEANETAAAAVEEVTEAATDVAEEVIAEVTEPLVAAAEQPASDFDVEGTYQASCYACHGTGMAGAPMPGDEGAWTARLELGMEVMMENVIYGVNAMPPKGLCMTCSDEDLRALVDYMIEQ